MFPEESFREHLQYDRFIFYIYTFFTKIIRIGFVFWEDDIMEHRQNF